MTASGDRASAAGVSEASRLSALISPLRRRLSGAARAAADLPDLPDAQIEVIRALPRGCVRRPGELASTLGLSRPTVSNLLNTMESRGLIARHVPEIDRRNVEVTATPEALELFDRFDEASAAIVDRALSLLTEDERRAVANVLPALERLSELLEANRANLAVLDHAAEGAA